MHFHNFAIIYPFRRAWPFVWINMNPHIRGCFVVLEKIFEILAKCIVSVRLGKLAWHSFSLWAFDLKLGRGVSPNLQPQRVSLGRINCPSFILVFTSSKCVSVTIRKVQKDDNPHPFKIKYNRLKNKDEEDKDRWSRMVIINVQQCLARDWVWLLNWQFR